jgi:hypothetical protein
MAGSDTGDTTAGIMTWQELEDWLSGEVKSEVQTWHAAANTRVSAHCKLSYVKANYVKMDGHYYDINTHEYVYPTPVAGSVAGAPPPNQICMAVSLTTGRDRGYAHRGRFYLPLPVHSLGTDGLVLSADAQNVANQAKIFLEALSDTPGIDGLQSPNVVVMSSANTGATYKITGVEVGRVLDTQRRRRAELKESYVSAVVDLGAG